MLKCANMSTMSRATKWSDAYAKYLKFVIPGKAYSPIVGSITGITAAVTEQGFLEIDTQAHQRLLLTDEQALALAEWLIATFGEGDM